MPKRVALQNQPGDEILAMTVDGQGIHAIVKNLSTNKMNHRVFNISTGNVEIDSKFPTETSAFLGLDPAKNVQFHSTGETEFVSLLLDGNRTVYPLAKDSTPSADSIKDPQWVDLPPIGAVGKSSQPIK